MKKILLVLIPVVLMITITIIHFPYHAPKETAQKKADPQTEMVKRIAKMIKEQSSTRVKDQKIPDVKPAPLIAEKEELQDRVMTSSLREDIKRSIKEGKKDIRIVLNTTDDKDEVSSSIINVGGKVIRKRHGFLAVEVPTDKAEQLIMGNSSIGYARLPFKFFPAVKVSEGVNLTGANIFHDTIYRGSGVKVAVVDVGFKDYKAAIAAGELPSKVITKDFSGSGLDTEYKHGTACAEIIHDMAPDAELYLLKIGDEVDTYDAIDYCIDNNIDIINLSMGTFGSGPGDGTGPLDEAFDELRAAGILVVASAGNFGNISNIIEGTTITVGLHWEGTFNDNDYDQWHEFKDYDSQCEYNVIGAVPSKDDDGNPETDEVSIVMRWDDWPLSNVDYDMYLYSYDYTNQKIGTQIIKSSLTVQDGTQPPVEYISLDVPDSVTDAVFYAIKVKRRTTGVPTGIKMEIYLGGTSQFVPFRQANGTINSSPLTTPESSISEPADAESVIAVGAINYTKWQTGPQEEYSSQGPTNAWNGHSSRIKPDIMGPDGVTTYSYGNGSFPGTSAAAPHVAGMAALLLSSNLSMTPDELQALLETNTIDMGTSGKDNLYGYGRSKVKDADNDGMPDYWEAKYGLNININDASADADGDGLTNITEYRSGTYPKDGDTDNDNMPDGWEVQYGLNPLVNDAEDDLDNDRFANLKEYQEGTLPNDRKSRPKRAMPWLPLLLGD